MNILVIGGNRFFGKSLVDLLSTQKHSVWVMNRGNVKVDYPKRATHIVGDREDLDLLEKTIKENEIEIVYDQVCFDALQAQSVVNLMERLANPSLRYIFTSTQAVYGAGTALKESDFDSYTYKFPKPIKTEEDYGEAKKQAEAVFFQSTFKNQISAVRFPIVIGSDDYTMRFKYHVDALKSEKEVFFPNLEASISFVHSDDAAIALYEIAKSFKPGPINICAKKPIKLRSFLSLLEDNFDKSFRLGNDPHKNYSPYGIGADWWMETEEMTSRGIVTKEIPDLITHVLRELETESE